MTDDRIIDIFEEHGQYVTPRDYALIRSIAEAIATQRTWVEVEQVKWEGDKLLAKLKEKNT